MRVNDGVSEHSRTRRKVHLCVNVYVGEILTSGETFLPRPKLLSSQAAPTQDLHSLHNTSRQPKNTSHIIVLDINLSSTMNLPSVEHISECFIKPKHDTEGSKQHIYLAPWDLAMPCLHYIQKGLLFLKPPNQVFSITTLLEKLKDSLSHTLTHFYPLAGRLATLKNESPHLYTIYINCENSPGARFVYATLDLAVSDILDRDDVPVIVQSFFDHDRAINHDGHVMSLLTAQVTELTDGVFIGCSVNHMVVDGTSFWHFFNSWSEVFNGKTLISRPPILDHLIPEGHGPILTLPFTHHDQFLRRLEATPLREKIFHFSSDSIANLKQKANLENSNFPIKISSLQSLSALVWRSITRARNFPYDQQTCCSLSINSRSRLVPSLTDNYFGNCVQTVRGTAQAGELLEQSLGWAARLLNRAVAEHTDEAARAYVSSWLKDPFVYQMDFFDPGSVHMGSSPRFEMYLNEFGLGRAVAVRSGYANGKVSLYQAADGGVGMDLEVCLLPEFMAALVKDEEFMGAVTISHRKTC